MCVSLFFYHSTTDSFRDVQYFANCQTQTLLVDVPSGAIDYRSNCEHARITLWEEEAPLSIGKKILYYK